MDQAGETPRDHGHTLKPERTSVDICTEYAAKTDWADFVPAMRGKVVNFEVVDEDEWEKRLNEVLTT